MYISGENNQVGLIEYVYVGEHNKFISYLRHRTTAAIFMVAMLLLASFFNLTRYILYPHRRIYFDLGILFFGLFLVSFSTAEIFYLFFTSVI